MTNSTNDRAVHKPWRESFLDSWQTVMAVSLSVFTLFTFTSYGELGAPEASSDLFWTTVAVGAVLTIVHLPGLFRRWPDSIKWMAYIAAVSYAVLWNYNLTALENAWAKTPVAIAERERTDREEAAQSAERERTDREEAAVREKERETNNRLARLRYEQIDLPKKMEACFSGEDHRLPGLAIAVKESAQNPRSFEHVTTVLIPKDELGYNVVMTFRAENGFGGLRTAEIRAKLNAESCEITEIQSEPTLL